MNTLSSCALSSTLFWTMSSVALAQGGPSLAPPISGLMKSVVESTKINLEMKNCQMSDVVTKIGKEYNVNVLADAYLNDESVEKLVINNASVENALKQIALSFRRNVYFVNGIYVLRSQNPIRKALDDAYVRQSLKFKWKNGGTIEIDRLYPPKTPVSNTGIVRDDPKKDDVKSDMKMPAHLISLRVIDAPVANVISDFVKSVGWSVNVESSLANKRVCIFLHRVTPSQSLGALTLLFNAAQTVVIRQTDAQREWDLALSDGRSPEQKSAEALRRQLLSSLSEDQKSALQDGREVRLPINSLPSAVQKSASDHIQLVFEVIKSGSQGPLGYDLEPSTFTNFTIVLKPDLRFETHGYMSNAQPPYTEGMPVVF